MLNITQARMDVLKLVVAGELDCSYATIDELKAINQLIDQEIMNDLINRSNSPMVFSGHEQETLN